MQAAQQSILDGSARPVLPDRNVTSDTLEDAYIGFIFYCNPALPADSDTQALREAFRAPPKSAGKAFEVFAIYEAVKQFYDKDIKTWTELVIHLGVIPPDVSNNESSQKVTQYGVRLKKWMQSLHVKAFFEYLMNISNDYWIHVPDHPDPTANPVRDGVLLEDDMALRALLPHIRPKRGRKTHAETMSQAEGPPWQRRKLGAAAMGDSEPWSAVHDSGMHLDAPRSVAPGIGVSDGSHTPMNRWPQSAMTPTVRGAFWDDALEPQSAVTPTHARRRGAKNVSSAWKPGGGDGGGKTRGRPPINRTPIEGPSPDYHPWGPTSVIQPIQEASTTSETLTPGSQQYPLHAQRSTSSTPSASSLPAVSSTPLARNAQQLLSATDSPGQQNPTSSKSRFGFEVARPPRPTISLQVPERTGGLIVETTFRPEVPVTTPIRIATPPQMASMQVESSAQPAAPPIVMINGLEAHVNEPEQAAERHNILNDEGGERYGFIRDPNNPKPGERNVPLYFFERMADRRNVDPLIAYFVRETYESQWLDPDGKPGEQGSIDESTAIVNATFEDLLRKNPSTDAFLLNLATLAGAKALMTTSTKSIRLGADDNNYNYRFEWEYRFGHLYGNYNMNQAIPKAMFKTPPPPHRHIPTPPEDATAAVALTSEEWQRKYQNLLGEVEKRERELSDLKSRMIKTVTEERG